MDLSRFKKIYIIGIEGAATSALARILVDRGIEGTTALARKMRIKAYGNCLHFVL